MDLYVKNNDGSFSKYGSRLSEIGDVFPNGAHLIVVEKNCTYKRLNVNLEIATILAVFLMNKDIITDILLKSNIIDSTYLTEEQITKYNELIESIKEKNGFVAFPSVSEAYETFVKNLSHKIAHMLENPNVNEAFEQFKFLCNLCGKDT